MFSTELFTLFSDVISSRTFHLREGFTRIFCIVPYEVISAEIWSQIMPNWMESVASEVPEEEMSDLKVILRYAFIALNDRNTYLT